MIKSAGCSSGENVVGLQERAFYPAKVNLGIDNDEEQILVKCDDSQPPNNVKDVSKNQWLADIKLTIEKKKSELRSDGRLIEVDTNFSIKLSRSERFFSALKSALDSLGNLMGGKEQCGLSGFSAASALVRGTIPGLKRLGGTEQFSIVGFVFSMVYLVTTSINLGTALRAYARSYETQSEHFSWIINHLTEVGKFAGNAEPTAAEAATFNEFMERVEKVSFLMNITERKVASAEAAVIREGVAMLPGGISSGLNSFNEVRVIFTKFVSSVFSGISGIFQVLGGIIDLKQACDDKEIARHNIREMTGKISGLKALPIYNKIKSIVKNIEEIKGIFKNDLKFADLRMFKGSMAISAGIAGLVMVGLKIAAIAGAAVLSAAAISLTVMSLSILTGLIMLCFLGTVTYITYNSIQDIKRSEKEILSAKSHIEKLNRDGNNVPIWDVKTNVFENNKYVELHYIAQACLKKDVSVLTDVEAKQILLKVGIKELQLKALIVDASNKSEEEGLEWFKNRIAKYLNISYDVRRRETTQEIKTLARPMTMNGIPDNEAIVKDFKEQLFPTEGNDLLTP